MDTAYYVLSAHAHNLAQYVGKGRQQAARICIIELSDRPQICSDIDAAARVGYRALVQECIANLHDHVLAWWPLAVPPTHRY